ncbi:hypothetical protein Sango_1708100 [Sesamum angolense]|uniref:Endoplasmic reticulum transmembrane protein n=1 Tax=Sesamum angolense TaxID=2727404 RepID=A0AAE2BS41_9LAMI|nr:hypothetical protein Sango_1708100 [Sesamum angolense]
MCSGEICTAAERDRYEKSIYKSQRNAVLCAAACLLYWCIYRICKYHREIQSMEELEKRSSSLRRYLKQESCKLTAIGSMKYCMN